MITVRQLLWAAYLGVAAAGVLIIVVFATGQTFGQRCAKLHESESPAWHSCVDHMAGRKNG